MKFGGSSVGEAACIQRVADIVESHHAAGDEVAVVVSACSGITDRIIAAADEAATSSEEPAIEEFISAMRERHIRLLEATAPDHT
ncbi:MAG TPA: aspartate kinase, partial [Methanoculleus sp.]|nr:aspartate kinase [Methanoculleus sp.]